MAIVQYGCGQVPMGVDVLGMDENSFIRQTTCAFAIARSCPVILQPFNRGNWEWSRKKEVSLRPLLCAAPAVTAAAAPKYRQRP